MVRILKVCQKELKEKILKHCEDALTYLNTVHYVRTLFGSVLEDFPNTSRLVAYS